MKLKHVAAFFVLLVAIGCTQQPSGQSSTATVEPETTQLASTTVSFDVTGMS